GDTKETPSSFQRHPFITAGFSTLINRGVQRLFDQRSGQIADIMRQQQQSSSASSTKHSYGHHVLLATCQNLFDLIWQRVSKDIVLWAALLTEALYLLRPDQRESANKDAE